MDKITITEERTDDKGRYVARVDGHEEIGIMTYSRVSEALIIVNHTEVPVALKGHGVGQALATHVISEARRKGFKIIPLCPFLAAEYKRHPEWSDVMKS